MEIVKMSDYVGVPEADAYGQVLNPEVLTKDIHLRHRLWKAIAALLHRTTEEWLPAPIDLADNGMEGVELWLRQTDNDDISRMLFNPGKDIEGSAALGVSFY